MQSEIRMATILIEEDELLPKSLRHQSEPYSTGWRRVQGLDRHTLSNEIEQAGWTFFYEEGEITAHGVGFGPERALRGAMDGVTAKLKWDRFNCLEITRVAETRCLGLCWVTVVARWRLLGPSLALTPEMSVPSARLLQRRSHPFHEPGWAA